MNGADRVIARHTGPFLEPNVHDHNSVPVRCAVHGVIAQASLGAELFCVGCKRWIDTLKQPANTLEPIGSLVRRQDEMKRRLLRKSRRSRK